MEDSTNNVDNVINLNNLTEEIEVNMDIDSGKDTIIESLDDIDINKVMEEEISNSLYNEHVEEDGFKVFVGNVPFSCDVVEFKNKFKDFEGYKTADLIINHQNNKYSRGFGFVVFDTKENGEKLMTHTLNIDGRELHFDKYKKKEIDKKIKKLKLFLRRIPLEATEDDFLKTINNKIEGEILQIKFNYNKTNDSPTGTGIAFMNDYETMKKMLSDKEIKLNDKETIYVYPYRPNKNTITGFMKQFKGDVSAAYKAGFQMGKGIV